MGIISTKLAGAGLAMLFMTAATTASAEIKFNAVASYPTVNAGVYSFTTSKYDPQLIKRNVFASGGGIAYDDGYFYGVRVETVMGITAIQQNSYDMSTWENEDSYTGKAESVATANTFDSDLGLAYGCYFNEDGVSYRFALAKPNYFSATTIAPLAKPWGACGFNKDGVLYAIEDDGTLVTVNTDNGAITIVGNTGLVNENITGGMVDKESNTMLYAIKTEAETALYSIDLATAKATKLYDLANEEQLGGFFTPAKEYAANVPGQSTSSVSLSVNSTDPFKANLAFYPPNLTYGKETGNGELTYHIYRNGTEIATGTTAYKGTRISVPVEVDKSGYYCYAVSFSDANGEGPRKRCDATYMGWDTPKAPASFSLTYTDGKLNLRWGGVSSGEHSGKIDRNNLIYRVTRYPDNKVVSAADLKTTSMTDEITTPEIRTRYHYTVEALTGGKVSKATSSPEFELGIITPPYETAFNSSSDFFEYSTLNPGADTKTWTYNSSKYIQVSTASKPADNWLILPALKLKAGESYEFTIEARSYSNSYTEEFEVMAGTTPTVEGLAQQVIAKTIVKSGSFVPFSGTIVAETDGTYYVGVHATTPTGGGYLYVNSIKIGKGVSDKAPAAVKQLVATADKTGAHSATIKFVAPSTTIGGKTLDAISKAELLRDGEVIKTVTDGITPGQECTIIDDTNPTAGKHSYSVICHNSYGAGVETKADAFIGFAAPSNPATVNMTEPSNGHVKATWTPVTTDVEGRTLTAADVKYNVYKYLAGELYPVVEGLTETTVEFDAFDGFEDFDGQRFMQTIIEAVTEGGSSKKVPSAQIAVGNPYKAPWSESFADCKVSSIFANQKIKGDDVWSMVTSDDFGTTPADGDGGMMMLEAYGRGACSLLTGKIDLGDIVSPAFIFQVYNYVSSSVNENVIEVEVRSDGDYVSVYRTELNQLGSDPAWCKVVVPLDDYAGQTIQLRISAYNNTLAMTHIDDLKITSVAPYNLSLRSVSAPASVEPNTEFSVSAEIENLGTERAQGFKVNFLSNDEIIETRSGLSLESEAKTTVDFTYTPGIMEVGDMNLAIEIDYGLDMFDGDNTKEFIVAVRANSLPTVNDLTASNANDNVVLNWSTPKSNEIPVANTEDFDSPAISWATQIEGWTFIDNDGGTLGGIGNKQLPVSGRQSFFVFNNTLPALQNGNIAAFNAHSGNQYLCAMYVQIGDRPVANDDWAISPELPGVPQTISLWASSFPSDPGDPQYYETFQILYSTTGTDMADFKLIAEYTNIPAAWKQYSAYLPEGTKYFAIRCVSDFQYMLFVDDVTFIAKNGATETVEPTGYNIYRDGAKLNAEPIVSTQYTDNDVDNKSIFNYVVTAVYKDGESMKSNEVTVDRSQSGIDSIVSGDIVITAGSGCVTITGAENADIEIYTVDGKKVAGTVGQNITTINLANGFYIVKAGNKTGKVTIK